MVLINPHVLHSLFFKCLDQSNIISKFASLLMLSHLILNMLIHFVHNFDVKLPHLLFAGIASIKLAFGHVFGLDVCHVRHPWDSELPSWGID